MPEKTKIHLKSGGKTGSNGAPLKPVRETKSSAARKAAILAKSQQQNFNKNKETESSKMDPISAELRSQQYKRSRSVGPVIEAAQRELLASAASIGNVSLARVSAEGASKDTMHLLPWKRRTT